MVNNHYLFGTVLLIVMFMGEGICALEPKQVSSAYFFDHYMENTTHIDIFEKEWPRFMLIMIQRQLIF